MRSLFSSRIVRSTLAILLTLWVAGIGCIFGCEGMVAIAANRTPHNGRQSEVLSLVSNQSCSSAKSHSCCAMKAESQEANFGRERRSNEFALKTQRIGPQGTTAAPLITTNNPSSGVKECPFAVSRVAVTARGRDNISGAAATITPSTLHSATPLEQTLSLSSPRRLPNRGHTYLRCCVFLI